MSVSSRNTIQNLPLHLSTKISWRDVSPLPHHTTGHQWHSQRKFKLVTRSQGDSVSSLLQFGTPELGDVVALSAALRSCCGGPLTWHLRSNELEQHLVPFGGPTAAQRISELLPLARAELRPRRDGLQTFTLTRSLSISMTSDDTLPFALVGLCTRSHLGEFCMAQEENAYSLHQVVNAERVIRQLVLRQRRQER